MCAQLYNSCQYYLHPISFISSFHVLLLISIPIFHAQVSYAQFDNYYRECSNTSTVRCGKTTFSIPEYPFWGISIRPLQCGLEGYELRCEENDLVIDIGSDSKYRVVEINPSGSFITLNRSDDSMGNICASRKVSSTLFNEALYDYGENTEDLHLFYNCDNEINSTWIDYTFTCPRDKKNPVYFFLGNKFYLVQEKLDSCSNTTLQVDKKVFEELKNNRIQPEELFKRSFVVHYNKMNEKACSDCKATGGLCWGGTYSKNNTCLHSNGTVLHPYPQQGNKKTWGLIIGIGGVLGGTILLISVLIIYCCRKHIRHGSLLFSRNESSYHKDVDAFIKEYGSSIPRRFRYSTIKKITNSFQDELGKGGYGNVYRGSLPDGRAVAVKVLNATKGNGEEFINEVASIGRTSHVNVVTLLGFCYEGKRQALIYEFMPNGSLEKFIYGTTPLFEGKHLGWEKLFNIATDIARGLEYLHRGCNTRILHFDIKPHNILLDKDFRPKISDFGLAKLYTTNESVFSSSLQTRGTIGYIAPELTNRNFGQVSHKSDVYSYGMMILEMVGGRKNVNARADHTSEIYYPHWLYKRIQFGDVLNLANQISEEENELARKMIIVGLWCIQIYPSQRPSMSKVIEMLEGQTATLEIPPCPYLCSVPSSPSISQTKLALYPPSGTEPTTSTFSLS